MDANKVWFFSQPIAKSITTMEAAGLQKRFEGRLSIVLMQDGNFGIYATNDLDEERLDRWMRKYAPLAQYKRVNLETI